MKEPEKERAGGLGGSQLCKISSAFPQTTGCLKHKPFRVFSEHNLNPRPLRSLCSRSKDLHIPFKQ